MAISTDPKGILAPPAHSHKSPLPPSTSSSSHPAPSPSIPTDCTICHTPFNTSQQDATVETPSILPCSHIFGSLCIKRWLGASQHHNCPNCRREMRYAGCGHGIIPKAIAVSKARESGLESGLDSGLSVKAVRREDMPSLCLLCRESREMGEVVGRAERRLVAEERALEGLRGVLPGLFGGLYKTESGSGFVDRPGEVRDRWSSEIEILTEGLRGRMEGREEW